jgi:hypothetical protein
LAYIKAITLLIAIFSSFIFPVQEFLDINTAEESSEKPIWIENNLILTASSDNLAQTIPNQTRPIKIVDHSSPTSNEVSNDSPRRNDNLGGLVSANPPNSLSKEKDLPSINYNSTSESSTYTKIEHKVFQELSVVNPNYTVGSSNKKLAEQSQTEQLSPPEAEISLLPVPVITIQYDEVNNYDARKTWQGVDDVDLLARSMLAEQNEKLFDPDRVSDFIGAGWVMVNRIKNDDDIFPYANGDLYRAVTPFQQFALGGYIDVGSRVYPGNVAYVANPEAYPGWFGGNPRGAYWKAYTIAQGILDGSTIDPTYGALYFADAYLDENDQLVYFADGRTRFWQGYTPCYTIPQIERLENPPWPPLQSSSDSPFPWSAMQHESQ